MIYGVGEEVPQDPFDSAWIDVGDDRIVWHVDYQFGTGFTGEVANSGHRGARTHPDVELLGRQFRNAGVVPGNLEQIGQQTFESVEFGDKQFRRASEYRIEALAAVVDEVRGHSHRSERVRSSWLTSDVKRFCRLPNSSSWVICFERLSAISLKDIARRAMSSSPRTGMRSLSRPSAKRTAILDADRIGSTTCRATSSEIAANRTSRTAPPINRVLRTSDRLRSSLASGNTRYNSRPEIDDAVGLPMIKAGPE